MYQLTVASGGGMGNVGTNYEQLISKLMQADGDSCKYIYSTLFDISSIFVYYMELLINVMFIL